MVNVVIELKYLSLYKNCKVTCHGQYVSNKHEFNVTLCWMGVETEDWGTCFHLRDYISIVTNA